MLSTAEYMEGWVASLRARKDVQLEIGTRVVAISPFGRKKECEIAEECPLEGNPFATSAIRIRVLQNPCWISSSETRYFDPTNPKLAK